MPKKASFPAPGMLYVCGHGAQIKDGVSYGNKVTYQHHGAWYGRWRPQLGAPQLKRKLGPKRTRGGSDGLTRSGSEARLRELMAIEATSAAAKQSMICCRPGCPGSFPPGVSMPTLRAC